MKKLICILFLMVFVAACQSAKDEMLEKQIESQTGSEVEVETSSGSQKITVESDTGNQEIVVKKGTGNDWCQEGAEWKMTATGGDAGTAKMVIQGIVNSGKYAGYCHVRYDVATADGTANADLYLNREGSGYQVVNANGQTFETSWKR